MSVFDWCLTGKHDECHRKYQRFIIEPNRKRGEPPTKVVLLDEWVYCGCLKRGCECYVKPADRPKTKKTRRKS